LPSPNLAFDLVGNLYDWIKISKPSQNNPIFSTSDNWNLTENMVNQAIKNTAKEFTFDPKFFKSHSLRIGGASTLAASNYPAYIIKILGGWKSLSFMRYLRLSTEAYSKALNSITNIKNFSTESMKQLNFNSFKILNIQHPHI